MKEINNNQIILDGQIEPFTISHKTKDETFYKSYISIKRRSNYIDKLPIIISETKLQSHNDIVQLNLVKTYNNVHIIGEIRTYNAHIDGKSKLKIFVFVNKLIINDVEENDNIVEIDGFICKEPIYRTTPSGKQITDLLVAINAEHTSYYVPSICWYDNAVYAKDLAIGTKVKIKGLLQSRLYTKHNDTKVAYELSIQSIKEIN